MGQLSLNRYHSFDDRACCSGIDVQFATCLAHPLSHTGEPQAYGQLVTDGTTPRTLETGIRVNS